MESNTLKINYRKKEHFLEEFARLNDLEIKRLASRNTDGLDVFFDKREKIIEILKHIEKQIKECVHAQFSDKKTLSINQRVDDDQKVINELLNRIIEQNRQIDILMRNSKGAIADEIHLLRKNRKSVSQYKSKTSHRQIDEEA